LEVSAFKSTVGTAVGEGRKENIFVANMRMESGALAHLEASFAADDHGSDPWSVYLKVLGTKGSARYSYNDWVVNAPHPAGAHSHTYVPYPETVRDEARFFVEEVVGRGTAPLSTVEDAIVCQKVIEGIETSAAEARHVKLR
jgi:predicted dehydrogenase